MKYKVPDGMLKAATVAYNAKTCSMGYKYVIDRSVTEATLEAAIRWLDDILHERNIDFHRAILQRGKERYPDNMMQRVAFEFGVSFARHYIRDLFLDPEPDIPEEIKDLWDSSPTPDTKRRTVEAYRRGQKNTQQRPEPQIMLAYMRVTKAMGAVTLTREEGDRIIEYVRGAIHDA